MVDEDLGMWIARLIAAVLVVVAGPVRGADIVPPDPWEVIHLARDLGDAEVTRDTMKDPRIVLKVEGRRETVTFYGCHLGRNCSSILLQARFVAADWTRDPPPGTAFEAWNAAKLFGRAWWSESGEAVLDHPVVMAGGLPKETLRATFDAWRRAVDDYREFLDIPND